MSTLDTMLAALGRRIDRDTGPRVRDRLQGYRFGDWLAQGANAPATTVVEVEDALDELLESAYRIGSRWGYLTGAVVGVTAGLILGVLAWLYAVFS